MFRDNIIAAIRTAAAVLGPAIVTGIVALFTRLNIQVEIDSSVGLALAGLLYAVIVGLWNFAVNWLSTHVNPKFGHILLIAKTPDYVSPHETVVKPAEEDYGFGGGENG